MLEEVPAVVADLFFSRCEHLIGGALSRARKRTDGQGTVTAIFSWPTGETSNFYVSIKVNDTGNGFESSEIPYEFDEFLSQAGFPIHALEVVTTTRESTAIRTIVLRMTETGQLAFVEDEEKPKFYEFSGTQVSMRTTSTEVGLERIRVYFAKLSMLSYQIEVTTTPREDTIQYAFSVGQKVNETGESHSGLDEVAIAACLRCKYVEVGGTFVIRPKTQDQPSLGVQWGFAVAGKKGPLKRGANMCVMTAFFNGLLQSSATLLCCLQHLEAILEELKWKDYGLCLRKGWEPHGDNAIGCYSEGLLPGLHLHLLLNISTLDQESNLKSAIVMAEPEPMATALEATLRQLEQGDARCCFWRNKQAVAQYFLPFLAEAIQRIVLQTSNEILKEECFGCVAGVEGVTKWADIGMGVEGLVNEILDKKATLSSTKTKRRRNLGKRNGSDSQA